MVLVIPNAKQTTTSTISHDPPLVINFVDLCLRSGLIVLPRTNKPIEQSVQVNRSTPFSNSSFRSLLHLRIKQQTTCFDNYKIIVVLEHLAGCGRCGSPWHCELSTVHLVSNTKNLIRHVCVYCNVIILNGRSNPLMSVSLYNWTSELSLMAF